MEDIIDADYTHAKKVCKDLEIKNLCKYQDFYIQSDTSLLADVFSNFRNVCFEIYGVNPAHIFSAPVDLLTDTDMLLMVLKK